MCTLWCHKVHWCLSDTPPKLLAPTRVLVRHFVDSFWFLSKHVEGTTRHQFQLPLFQALDDCLFCSDLHSKLHRSKVANPIKLRPLSHTVIAVQLVDLWSSSGRGTCQSVRWGLGWRWRRCTGFSPDHSRRTGLHGRDGRCRRFDSFKLKHKVFKYYLPSGARTHTGGLLVEQQLLMASCYLSPRQRFCSTEKIKESSWSTHLSR